MTTKELIEKLKEFDENRDVRIRIELHENIDYLDFGHVITLLETVRNARPSYPYSIVLEGSLKHG